MESVLSPEVTVAQARQALERALSEVRTDADANSLIQHLLARARRAAAIARAVHAMRDRDRSAPEIFAAAARELAAAIPEEGSALDEGVLRATNAETTVF